MLSKFCIIKKTMFITCLLFNSIISYAQNTSNNLINNANNIKNTYLSYYVNDIDVIQNINITNGNLTESNLSKTECIIKLNTLNNKLLNTLFNDEKTNSIFIILHEIAHCQLGNDLFKNGIQWETISNEKKQLNELLIHNVKSIVILQHLNLNETDDNIPLLYIYHEMYADIQAFVWLSILYPDLNLNNLMNELINNRQLEENKELNLHKKVTHPTGKAIENLKNYFPLIKENMHFKSSIKEQQKMLEKIAQISFLDYLNQQTLVNY